MVLQGAQEGAAPEWCVCRSSEGRAELPLPEPPWGPVKHHLWESQQHSQTASANFSSMLSEILQWIWGFLIKWITCSRAHCSNWNKPGKRKFLLTTRLLNKCFFSSLLKINKSLIHCFSSPSFHKAKQTFSLPEAPSSPPTLRNNLKHLMFLTSILQTLLFINSYTPKRCRTPSFAAFFLVKEWKLTAPAFPLSRQAFLSRPQGSGSRETAAPVGCSSVCSLSPELPALDKGGI